MTKVTEKQLDELCTVLSKTLDNSGVRDADDIMGNFRGWLDYYDMIAKKEGTDHD